MKRVPILATIAFTSILLISALPMSAASAKATGLVLAVVDGRPVTDNDMIAAFSSRHSGHAKFLGGESEARRFLNILVEDRLLINEAYALGLDQEPEAARMVNEFSLRTAANYLVKQELKLDAKPSPAEIRQVWEEKLETVFQARQLRLFTKEEAETARVALLAGADPERLARECSQADTSTRGGLIIAAWGQLPIAVESVILSLYPGDVSSVIETEDGFEVYLIENRVQVPRPPLEKVSEEIQTTLATRQLNVRKQALSNRLWEKYHVALEPLDLSPATVSRMLVSAPDTVVARWDGGGSLKLKEAVDQQQLASFDPVSPVHARNQVVEQIRGSIHGPLMMLEAKERKATAFPEVATAIATYRDYLVESLLFRDHIFRNLAVTDDEIKAYYGSHAAAFEAPEERKIAHVLVATEEDANQALKEITAGATFEDVVKKRSRDFQSAMTGGDLGWVPADRVPPMFKAVLDLKAGELSKPIHGDRGWHVMRVVEIKPKRVRTIEEAKDELRSRALDAKKREARVTWVKQLRAAATIRIDDKAIAKFVKQNEFDASAAVPAPQHSMPAGALPEGAMPGTQPH